MIDRSPRSGISRKRNRRSAAQPARAGRVGLNVGRSADRRRWLGAPLAHEDSARTRVTGFDNADLSMPPVWRYPVTPARARRRGGRMIDRSPRSGISRKRNRRSAAQPARAGRVGLNVGRSADRRRWLGAPLAHEDSARTRVTGRQRVALLTNVAGKISKKNYRKRTLEKEIGEAPPSRLERVGPLAERVARLRLARARGKCVPLG